MAVSDVGRVGGAGFNVTINATQQMRDLVEMMERISNGTALHQYWADQETMIGRVTKAYKDYTRAVSERRDTSAVGQEFLKSLNALRGRFGDGIYSEIAAKDREAIKELGKQLSATFEVVNSNYSVANFEKLFKVIEMAGSRSDELITSLEKLNSLSGVDNAITRINTLEKSLTRAQNRIVELQETINKSTDVDALADLEAQRELLIEKNIAEFKALASVARLPSSTYTDGDYSEHYLDTRMEEAFEQIRSGSFSAAEAMSYLKEQYTELFTDRSTVDAASDQMQSLISTVDEVKTGLTEVQTKIESIATDGVKVQPGSTVAGIDNSAVHSTVEELKQLVSASDEAKQPTNDVAQSVIRLVEALSQLTSPDNADTSASVQSILWRLTQLKDIKIPQGPLNALIRFASSLRDVGSVDNVRAISGLDFSGFKALETMQTRGGPLYAMAKYLPMIAQVPVAPLEALSRVDFANIASGLAQFSGKDIKFRFDTAMGDESGALADSTKRFADHTEQVYKAVEAEKAKEEQAVKLTEVLGREATALTKVEAGQPTATNAILGGLHQPFGSTEKNIQELTDGLKRVGIADADILRIVQSMDSFDASVAKVKTQVNETTGELLTMEITAKNAANTATTVWKGFFNGKEKKWEWRNNTSYDLAKEQSNAKKRAEEDERARQKQEEQWAKDEAAYYAEQQRLQEQAEREKAVQIDQGVKAHNAAVEAEERALKESTQREIAYDDAVREAHHDAVKSMERDNEAAQKSAEKLREAEDRQASQESQTWAKSRSQANKELTKSLQEADKQLETHIRLEDEAYGASQKASKSDVDWWDAQETKREKAEERKNEAEHNAAVRKAQQEAKAVEQAAKTQAKTTESWVKRSAEVYDQLLSKQKEYYDLQKQIAANPTSERVPEWKNEALRIQGQIVELEDVAAGYDKVAKSSGVYANYQERLHKVILDYEDTLDRIHSKQTTKDEATQISSAKDAYDKLLAAYKQYYDLQSKLAANPNSSGAAMWQQQLYDLQQQLPILEAEANKYRDIADKAGILNKYTEQRTALENNYLNVLAQAVDKLDAADKKTQQAALTTSYTALTAQMQRMYDLQTRIANNPNSPNVETWQAEADVLRSQVEHNEQVLHQYDEMAQELGLLNKYQTKRNQLEQDYMALVRDLWQKRADKAATQAEKDQAQAQANAIKTWQAALQAVSETTPSLRLHLIDRSSLADLDDLRNKLRDAFGDLRNISEAAVKNGAVEFSDEQIKALSALNTLLEQYINKRNELQRQSRNDSAVGSDESAVAKVRAKVAAEYERYRSAIDKSADSLARFREIESRAAKLQNGDTEGIKKVITDLNTLIADLIKGGATVDSVMQKLSKGFTGKLFYGVLARASMYVRQFFRRIVTNVKEVNTALTQLQIVTRGTSNDMVAYFDRAAESAQRLGVSMKDLIDSTTTFARLGYSAEESSMLADYVAMLTKVGAIDTSDATDAVTAMVKAFDIELEDLQSVMDKMVIVGNNFPISVSQIAEGMNNASSALAAAGNSVEESMALLTAANTTVQNISKSSTGLRTIAARLRKTVVSDDGEEEAMSESDYNDLVKALTKQKVALTDINGEYRSTYDIIQDIASVWDSMSSMDQAALAEKLAGTRQQNIFYSLVGQFKEAQGAVEATTEAGGEMAAAYDVYLDSVEGELGKLNATFQVFSNDFLSSDTFNAVLNFGNGMLGVADALAKVNTLLPLLATGVMARKAYTSIAATEGFRDVLKGLVEQNTAIGKQSGLLTKLKAAWQSMGTSMKVALGVGAAVTVISTVIGLIQQESEARKKAAEEDYRSFTKSSEAIDDYKTKIKELKEQLDKGNLSEEQAYEVRKELLSIQDDMIQKLGDEAGAFDILKDSIDDVNEALDRNRQKTARKNLGDNAKYYRDAVRLATESINDSVLLLGSDRSEIADIYNDVFGDMVQQRFGATVYQPLNRQDGLRQLQEAYDRIYELDQRGLDGSYSAELNMIANGIQLIQKLSNWDQWNTGFTSFDDVQVALQEYVVQTVAASETLSSAYDTLSRAPSEFADAVARGDDRVARSIYDAIGDMDFGKVTNKQVRQYFEDLQDEFKTYADTYIIDIDLRTNLKTAGAKQVISQTLRALSYKTDDQLRQEMNEAAADYNALINGNLDYRKRPVLTADQMWAAGYTEFPAEDFATTYHQDYVVGNAMVSITPILDNGEVLTQKALDDYVDSLNPDDILGSDSKHIVINVSTDPDFDPEAFNDSLVAAKEKHLDAYLQLNGYGPSNTAAWLKNANLDDSGLNDSQLAALNRLRDIAQENDITFDHLIDTLVELGYVEGQTAQATNTLVSALTITQLDTTRGVVKSFHDAWTSMTSDGEVAFDKLKGIFSALTDKDGKALVDGLDGYIARLAELRNDVPATEAVLNELFSAYVEGQINGDSLAESDLHLVEAMLKEAGVANETEVALDLLVTAKLKAADANGTLIDASGNLDATLIAEIQALIGDGDAAVYAATKLAELELQKIILSNNPLNMTSSISTLSALAGQSTTTAAALAGLFAAVEKVQSISTRIESLEAQLSPDITKDYFSEAERIGRVMDELAALRGQQTSFSSLIMTETKRAMEELSSALPYTGIQWTPPTASGSGSGGSTKTFADTLKERYEAENKSLEAQLDLLKHQYDEYRRIGDDDRANQNLRDQAAIYDIIMANAHDAAEELRNYYLSLGLTLDEINKQADVLEYSNIWWDAYEKKLALVQQQLDDLKQSLDDVTGELDSFQNIYKTLISAAEQYHTDGFLHIDTLKEILAFGPEYLQFLSDENGQLSYNEEALQKVIAAKTEEMAIDTALMYLRRVMSAVESNNANELKKLADITNLTAQNTWALVDAQLALVQDKVSEQYYNNISTNINRLKSLTVSATSAISQYSDSLHSSYMSQKDGMEQLFDIVKEYVKWENEHHIELLEEEKKKYGELVDKKKEMLDLAKSEDDHNKSVAKKLKEIADLETRIALLELDDSREAQAEKAKLQKELAEKNDDLTDSQQSYYIDKQKEALDKDKENFEKKKDSEIDILKKELDTEEKLYQATLTRIQTEWTNGWGNFYNTLKQWNVEYGSHLSSTLAGVLYKASEAIGKWGDPLTALQQVSNDELISDTRDEMRANALRWWTTFDDERDRLPGENQRLADLFNEITGLGLTPRNGAWYLGDGSRFFELSKDEIAAAIIAAMQANSAGWFTASKEEQQVLAQNNVDLAARLGEVLGEILTRKDGVWYRADGTRLYSEGGVADYTGTAILHGGKAAELVLNNADVSKVYDLIHNTPSLVGSFFSKMLGNANSVFRNGNYGTGGGDINMDFNVTINHTGSMSDADARRYGDTIASAALDKLRDTFSKRGVRSVGPATLKA